MFGTPRFSSRNVWYPPQNDIFENVSYPQNEIGKMFRTPKINRAKCFIPPLQILRPGMQCKK